MITMEVSKIPKYRNLTESERILIARWINGGESNGWIAKELGRSVSTVGREVKRNSSGNVYEPLHAHGKALRKRQKAFNAKHPLKNRRCFHG